MINEKTALNRTVHNGKISNWFVHTFWNTVFFFSKCSCDRFLSIRSNSSFTTQRRAMEFSIFPDFFPTKIMLFSIFCRLISHRTEIRDKLSACVDSEQSVERSVHTRGWIGPTEYPKTSRLAGVRVSFYVFNLTIHYYTYKSNTMTRNTSTDQHFTS